ncbi:MAG: LysM peptidoglycan-binding domain-containing protein [Verrucomicrobiae bacterium]|nr:LysM peptidoglycan-binding domain-containing protein [Verrucomicrobiae bacterium]MDW8343045.1 LysM peptidoglycan-binding domain-containing protein [Verrucomicrobiae bacterium]
MKQNSDNCFLVRLLASLILTSAILVIGCYQVGETANTELAQNPYARRAKEAIQNRNFAAAAELYRKALRVNPDLAGAHLELGLLYDDKLGDPIAAIYHYRCFLELRPDSPKRALVEDFIERAKLNLLTKLGPVVPNAPPAAWQTEKAVLLEQNAALQARVLELERQLADVSALARTVPVVEQLPRPVSPPVASAATIPEAGSPRIHTVQPRDTLQSLALRYYGSRSEWTKIYAANRHHLASKDDLKIGQQLIIP